MPFGVVCPRNNFVTSNIPLCEYAYKFKAGNTFIYYSSIIYILLLIIYFEIYVK